MFLWFVLLGFCSFFIHLYNILWLKPERLRSKLRRQGIRGPSPSPLLGNIPEMKRIQSQLIKPPYKDGFVSHDWAHFLFPYFNHWKKEYGPILMCSMGNIQLLYVSHKEMVKEMSLCTSLDLGKPTYLQRERGPLLGQGILTSNGAVWAHQRKIIAPELYMKRVKVIRMPSGMVNLMVESATSLVNSWEMKIESDGGIRDVRIDEDLRSFSADVISRACFGSNYSSGREIFVRLRALQQVMSKKSLLMGLPGLRYLPTKNNREIWRLEKEIRSLILELVKERKEAIFERDLLQMIIDGAKDDERGPVSADNFIVDNCKNIYFAGHETTAMSACWTLVLLASNPEWQARVRAEVLQLCGGLAPDADMLRKMKLLTMVIQEAMRLYPTVVFMSREALEEMKLGEIHVPKGVNIWIPVITLHRDPDIWGPDADEFNPERFANGISGACKLPHLYLPFGAGPRICAGQNLAMTELKIILALIISNFSLSISPKYRHSPVFKLVIEPEHGVNLLIRRVQFEKCSLEE
ncbi:hypothetical protein HHK36_002825 [Tetracentron sinense]|uniref:Cytochrome P450 n=1 Tax=Tetracentron sinense TaxID=13715 RepID=A0A835DRJ3_TETSI|nr:hypothetical protein HHK36_002825 [Tetracentron sinense]